MLLIRPSTAYKESYLALVKEFLADTEQINPFVIREDTVDWEGFLQKMRDLETGHNLRAGLVPCITFWMVDDDGEVVGASNIRTRLNKRLIQGGGHIGYGVRPSRRRQGNATELLRLSLLECARMGIMDVMVSCSPGNEGSRKTILNNGGVFDSLSAASGEELERYWIFL